jgi:hypothetical protein
VKSSIFLPLEVSPTPVDYHSKMADPFSIIGLVGSSLGGIIKAKEWLDGIRRAPQSIQALSVELRAIESLLRELGTLLNSFNSATRDQAGRLVRDAVRNCEAMLRQIDVLLRPFVTVDSDTSIATWKRFAFTFRESDITPLRREMESCKQTLNMAINCANLYVQCLWQTSFKSYQTLTAITIGWQHKMSIVE